MEESMSKKLMVVFSLFLLLVSGTLSIANASSLHDSADEIGQQKQPNPNEPNGTQLIHNIDFHGIVQQKPPGYPEATLTRDVDPMPSVDTPFKLDGTMNPNVILDNWFYVGDSLGGTPDIAFNFVYNDYLVAWTTSDVDGSGWNHAVYVRAFTRDGSAYGTAKFIGYRQQNEPQVAYNSDADEYLIGWGPLTELYVQRLSWDGSPLGTAVQVYSDVGWTAGLLEIVYNYIEDEYFVLFQDKDWKLRGQRVASNGSLIGSSFVIQESNCGGDVVYNWHNNTYLVVGTRYDNGRDIWGRILDGADGSTLGTSIVETYDGDQDCPKATWNSFNNEYLVVWADDWDGEEAIYGRRLTYSGTRTGNYVPLATTSMGNITYPDDVVFNWNDGSFIAGWYTSWVGSDYQEHRRSYVRSVTRDGLTPFPAKFVESEFIGNLALTNGDANNYVVVETDTTHSIYGRFLKSWETVFLPSVVR
jgi:hypothetical protein